MKLERTNGTRGLRSWWQGTTEDFPRHFSLVPQRCWILVALVYCDLGAQIMETEQTQWEELRLPVGRHPSLAPCSPSILCTC